MTMRTPTTENSYQSTSNPQCGRALDADIFRRVRDIMHRLQMRTGSRGGSMKRWMLAGAAALMVLSIFSGVTLADNSDRSNKIPPDFQDRKSSLEVQDTMPIVSNPISANSLDVEASSTLSIDETLADMINLTFRRSPSIFHNF